MKKGLFKKIIASVLTITLAFSLSGFVFGASHAANGANVLPGSFKWTSFSVRDDLHNGGYNTEWEDALLKEMDNAKKEALKEYQSGKISEAEYNLKIAEIDGWQSSTEGWVPDASNTASNVTLYCKNTGWDGEYAKTGDKALVGDNPWGLTLTMEKIPVEFGRYYTLEFDIAAELLADVKQPDETTIKDRIDKHALVKAYDYQSRGGPAAAFETFTVNGKDGSKDGTFVIAKTPKEQSLVTTHISATFRIPDTKEEWSGGRDSGSFTHLGIKFAMGAFLYTYKDEVGANGNIYIKNLKLLAGKQYTVKYYDGSKVKAVRYVNEGEQAKSVALQKKGHTLSYYINMANGSKYNFASLVERDLNLKAKWIKTPKPKKASFKVKSPKKRRALVTFGKNANAKGYEVTTSLNKKFKKKAKFKTKTKTTSKTTKYTIKSLKSSSVVYVKARAFNKDSCGKKVFGKWSKRKSVFVK